MANRKWINRGVGSAAGLFLANALVLPLISDRSFGPGLFRGLIGAALVMLFFAGIAAFQGERSSDEESGRNFRS